MSGTRPLAERFWEKVIPEPNTGCWLWTGAVNQKGYGKIGGEAPSRRTLIASRVAWELTNGPIPEHPSRHGLCVCHKCDNPPCVNPGHLFLGTIGDNLRDMGRKGRTRAQRNPEFYRPFLAKAHAAQIAKAKARPDPACIHCGGPARNRWFGRCHTCDRYFRRHGREREPHLLAGETWRNLARKLSDSDVLEIVRRHAMGERQVDLARAFGVSKGHLNNIVRGRLRTTAASRVSPSPEENNR